MPQRRMLDGLFLRHLRELQLGTTPYPILPREESKKDSDSASLSNREALYFVVVNQEALLSPNRHNLNFIRGTL